jgi:hypothetical protein
MTSRFNLDLLRIVAASASDTPQRRAGAGKITRRSFLGVSGGTMALGALPAIALNRPFSIRREGRAAHVLVAGEPRWTINPEFFGSAAELAIKDTSASVRISLRNATFPNTSLPADFECRLGQSAAGWTVNLKFASGLEVAADLLPWLLADIPAEGKWNVAEIAPCKGFSLKLAGGAIAHFLPDWSIALGGKASAYVDGINSRLPVSGCTFRLDDRPGIGANCDGHRTVFTLARGSGKWKLDLTRASQQGWELTHDVAEELFDELRVEAAQGQDGPLHSALLLQHAERPPVPLRLFTGGGLHADSGEPFHLSLSKPRLALSLGDESRHRTLIADLSEEPRWAHAIDASFLVAATAQSPHFELHDGPGATGTPTVSPGLCEVCFPSDATCIGLKLGTPRPVPFTWADLAAPFERLMGWLHLLPSQHGKLVIDLQGKDHLYVDRPRDLLSLKFKFENMRLVTGAFPRIVRVRDADKAKISVIFPPQHLREQAFFRTSADGAGSQPDDSFRKVEVPIGRVELKEFLPSLALQNIPDPLQLNALKSILDPTCDPSAPHQQGTLGDPYTDPVRITLANETKLVFELPRHHHEIACEIESLLRWDEWMPCVAPVARSDVRPDPTSLPTIADPGDAYTSIELPFHLQLSPSEMGRWAHRVKPLDSARTRAVELWHTRLAILGHRPVPHSKEVKDYIDETTSKGRVVRAIWSEGFKPISNPACTPFLPSQLPAHFSPHNLSAEDPYRASMDTRDRYEIVHLTSNYGIPKREHFCETGSVLPSSDHADYLLPPAPVQINNMMLTALGGYLDALGQWNPCKIDENNQLTVQMWRHVATLGRDHYVKVVYKGYLAPFGLPASLVKVTQRAFESVAGKGFVAVLHQHMYIVVKNERKRCPATGQPFSGRQFPFTYVTPVTLETPYLNDPGNQTWLNQSTKYQDQSLFWPTTASGAYQFRLRFTDITGVHSAESSMPLVFVASDVAQQEGFGTGPGYYKSQDAVLLYNQGSGTKDAFGDDKSLTANFGGQRLSFAKSARPGDTDFDTSSMTWRAVGLSASVSGTITIQSMPPAPSIKATVTFVEQNSGAESQTAADALGRFSLKLPSGQYKVAVTPFGAHAAVVTWSEVITALGSRDYSLPLALTADSHSGVGPATLTESGNPGITADQLYRYDLPYFYPAMDYARITSTSIKRITGITDPTKFTFFPTYLTDSFDAKANPGEVVLQKHPDDVLALAFGGPAKNVDKAGGLASPDTQVVGFSRRSGAVGGRMDNIAKGDNGLIVTSASTFSSGGFNPADFFGGLLSAKLLGAVKLSDIIAGLAPDLASNLAKAPQMLEQATYAAEEYTVPAVGLIRAFQATANPLATRVSAQAQAVFAAESDVANADISNPFDGAVKEGQLVARIVDYGGALQRALEDPVSLIEDAILQVFAAEIDELISMQANLIQGELANLSQAFSATLDKAIGDALVALDQIDSLIDKCGDDTPVECINDALTNTSGPIAQFAPDLSNLLAVASVAKDMASEIGKLRSDLNGAATSNPLTVQNLPQILADINSVANDIGQIYEKTGYLGAVVSATKVANSQVQLDILATRKTLLQFWMKTDYSLMASDLDALSDNCIQLAADAIYAQADAQQILQDLRQLQQAVNSATAYRNANASSDQDLYRQLQLLQKMQGNALRALADLQVIVQNVPGGASSASRTIAAAIDAALPGLVGGLTVATALWDTSDANHAFIEQQAAVFIGNAVLEKTLNAQSADFKVQLQALRDQLKDQTTSAPVNIGLVAAHYNLSIDYQRPLASALGYLAYLHDLANATLQQALDSLNEILAPSEGLATQLQSSLCSLRSLWQTLYASLAGAQGANEDSTDPVPVLGTIIVSLFGQGLDAITQAFDDLCDPAQNTPSELLRNSRAVVAAFSSLEADARTKLNSIPAVADAALDALKAEAQRLIESLLANVPIPTSVNVSYDWKPDIKSFEPVFILGDNASFVVTAKAQAGLGSSAQLTAGYDISATLTDFRINLIGDPTFITLVIDSLAFTSHNGSKPDCRMSLNRVEFGSSLQFVEELASLLDPSDGPYIELADASIRAGFRFAVPALTMGAFNLMQLAIDVAVALPFDGDPVRCELGLSDQEQPFLLSCGVFGGGGFLQLQLGLDGVQLLQGALEFGVCAAISIGPLQGSGYVVAGIYMRVTSNDSEVCGFVHAHGHMDIFGIISMDVDVYVGICSDGGDATGEATFTVSISIGFFSESYSMTAHYQYQGSSKQSQVAQKTEARIEATAVSAAVNTGAQALIAPAAQVVTPPQTPKKAPAFVTQEQWSRYYNAFVS